ncbi:MAG: hypothetical protein K2W96_02395 [Gemmataceae bacterium]|nr:hypothetical protein [Gemmataceae bacterium]
MDAVKAVDWDLSGLRVPPSPDEGPRRTWAGLLNDLARIRGYEDDWDGDGTEAIAPGLMDAAAALAQALEAAGWPAADIVSGTRDATINFYWRSAVGSLNLDVVSATEAESAWIPKGATRAEIGKFARG